MLELSQSAPLESLPLKLEKQPARGARPVALASATKQPPFWYENSPAPAHVEMKLKAVHSAKVAFCR